MKFFIIILISMVFIVAGTLQAQVSVNVHIGSPPMWGPIGFAAAKYYYLPDVEAYYDVRSSMFIYYGGGTWVHRAYLPARYSGYDLYRGYKVVMPDYHGAAPYTHFKEHKIKYAPGYHGKPQRTIGERPGSGNPGVKHSNGGDQGRQQDGNGHNGNEKHYKDQGKSAGSDQGNSHSQEKHKNDDHGHGNGNGKKK